MARVLDLNRSSPRVLNIPRNVMYYLPNAKNQSICRRRFTNQIDMEFTSAGIFKLLCSLSVV